MQELRDLSERLDRTRIAEKEVASKINDLTSKWDERRRAVAERKAKKRVEVCKLRGDTLDLPNDPDDQEKDVETRSAQLQNIPR